MNGLLEYIVLHHFGYITIALSLLLASLVIRNKLAQLISLLKTQVVSPPLGNPKPTPTVNLPVLNLEPTKPKPLTEAQFIEVFGRPPDKEISPTRKVAAPSSPPSPQPQKEEEGPSLSQLLIKAARGDKK